MGDFWERLGPRCYSHLCSARLYQLIVFVAKGFVSHFILFQWQKWHLAAKCCAIQNAVWCSFLQRIVAVPFIRIIKPFHICCAYQEGIECFNCRAASIFLSKQPTQPRDSLNSKQKATAVAAAAPAVCLLSRSFAGINTYIFKLKSAASAGDPAALTLLRLSPAHFSGQFKKQKKANNDGNIWETFIYLTIYEHREKNKTRTVFSALKSRSGGSEDCHRTIVAQWLAASARPPSRASTCATSGNAE